MMHSLIKRSLMAFGGLAIAAFPALAKDLVGRSKFDIASDRGNVELIITIPQTRIYSFELEFQAGRKSFDELQSLLDRPKSDRGGSGPRKSGIPLAVQLRVDRLDEGGGGPVTIVDEFVTSLPLFSWSGTELNKKIKDVKLGQGRYRVVAVNRIAAPEFSEVPVYFVITRAYLGK